MSVSFGDLLRQHLARRRGLTQKRLAELAGYDQALLTRMVQGKKDLTGRSGRERVVQLICVLRDEGVLRTRAEANALLKAGGMAPMYEGQPVEAALLRSLESEPPPAAAYAPVIRPASPPCTNLPAPLSSFIGRGRETAEVMRLLGTTRLLTLTGSGGCGKTRLAVEVGSTFVGATNRPQAAIDHGSVGDALPLKPFHDGVWLVDLAPLADPALVAPTLLQVFALTESPDRPPLVTLTSYLGAKRLLLLLDNCEHLIGACAELVAGLLRACPHLRVLATSREALNVPGEVTWRVPPLRTPDPARPLPPAHMLDYEAVRLFVQQTRAAQPELVLTPENVAAVAQICHRLGGIPLAIELAAARMRVLSADQIASRLDDRFALLTAGSRTALPRHRTLRAMIDWSYDLLTEPERALLRGLSVFAGGWTLEAAEAVHGGAGTLPLLAELVNKSLVEVEATPLGVRYRLHETIRQYALEKLITSGAEEDTRQRHQAFFRRFVEEAEPHIRRGRAERGGWLARLQADLDNLRATLDRVAQARDAGAGERLAVGLFEYWCAYGLYAEGVRWVNAFLVAPSSPRDHAYVLGRFMAGKLAVRPDDYPHAHEWLEEAARLAPALGDWQLLLLVLMDLGLVIPDYERAIKVQTEAVHLAGELGNANDKVLALAFLGWRMMMHGDHMGAARALTESVNIGRMLHDDGHLAFALEAVGELAFVQGDFAQARAAFEEAIPLACRANEDPSVLARSRYELAKVALRQQRPDEAAGLVCESIRQFHREGNLDRVADCLAVAAGVAQALGECERGARWLGAVACIRRDFGRQTVLKEWLYLEYEYRLSALREVMAPTDFNRAFAAGEHMTAAQAVDEVRAMCESPGAAARAAGRTMTHDPAVAYALRGGEADEPPVW